MLIEAMLSVAILSVSVTFVIQSLTSSLRATVYSADYTKAIVLLENKMVALFQAGFIDAGMSKEESFPDPYSEFKYALVTKKMPGSDQDNINLVTLDVVWMSGKKKNSIFLETYLFNQPQDGK